MKAWGVARLAGEMAPASPFFLFNPPGQRSGPPTPFAFDVPLSRTDDWPHDRASLLVL